MSDEKEKNAGLPSFRITEKKVDQSWKEEVRKEREKVKSEPAPAAAAPGARPKGKAPEGEPAPEAGGTQPSKVFMGFLSTLVQQALMQMGLIESPFSGQREVDLEGARYTVELLTVIQEKTKGNLAAQEERALNEALRELKVHYVSLANEVNRQMQEQIKKSEPGRKK